MTTAEQRAALTPAPAKPRMRTMTTQVAHERSQDGAAPSPKTLVVTPHPDSLPAKPGPPEAFDDDLAPEDWADTLPWGDRKTTGRDSNIVNLVFHSRCAGYRERPTSRALYDGMRTTTPTREQAHAIRTWLDHATVEQHWFAWAERVYSWRMLANAMRHAGFTDAEKVRTLNEHAARRHLIPARDRRRRG